MNVRWVVLALALVGAESVAHADEADELFKQGQALIAAGHVDEACAKFAASLQADPQIGTALNLGDCREQQHRYVDAYRMFANAEVEAVARGDKRAAFARQRQHDLVKHVVRVRVQVEAPNTPGLVIRIADRTLGRDEWSTVQVADPGVVELTAAAPGYGAYQDSETGTAGAQLTFEVPALTPAGTTPTPTPTGTPTVVTHASRPTRSKVPFLVGGAGAALIITSVALAVSAKRAYDDIADLPDPTQHDRDRVDQLQRRADIGTVVGLVGIAAVATGVVLFVRDRHHEHVVAVTPTSTSTSVGLALSGSL